MANLAPAVPSVRRSVACLCLVQFIDVMGVTVVITALPDMLADVDASTTAGSLVVTGYAMCFGGLLMLGARLGDRYGHRRVIVASLVVFAIAAALAATATSVVTLTIARCLQGAAAAGSVPAALRLLTSVTRTEDQRRKAIAAWSAAGAMAGSAGFVVGGVVSDLTSWRVVFWAYLPMMLGLAVAIVRLVPDDEDRDSRIALNLTGTTVFTLAAMSVVVGASLVREPGLGAVGATLLAIGVVLAVAFVRLDPRAKAPVLPRTVLAAASVRHGTTGALLNTFTTSSVLTLTTLYLQDTLGRSPLAAAAVLLPVSVGAVVGSTATAFLSRRLRLHQIGAIGLALIATAIVGLVLVAPSVWAMSGCVGAAGIGLGVSSVAATALGTDVSTTWRATASGINNTAAQLGSAFGIAAILLIAGATGRTPDVGVPPPYAAWLVAAGLGALGAAAFVVWSRRPKPNPSLRA